MAEFTTVQATTQSVSEATNVLNALRSVYSQAKTAQRLITLYQAGTDPVFNAAVNAIFTSAQRAELSNMLGDVNTLLTDWEANHRSALGLPPQP